MFYYTNKTKFNKQEKIETSSWKCIQAPEFSSVLVTLYTHVIRQGCIVLVTKPYLFTFCHIYLCPFPAFQLSVPYFSVFTIFVIPNSWPIGRRAVWLPCIQWHFSTDLVGFSFWGTFSCVCHFGRAKGRSVHENDCVLGDREQTVGCGKL